MWWAKNQLYIILVFKPYLIHDAYARAQTRMIWGAEKTEEFIIVQYATGGGCWHSRCSKVLQRLVINCDLLTASTYHISF